MAGKINNSFDKPSPDNQQVPKDIYNKKYKTVTFKNTTLNNIDLLIIVNSLIRTTSKALIEIIRQLVGNFQYMGFLKQLIIK